MPLLTATSVLSTFISTRATPIPATPPAIVKIRGSAIDSRTSCPRDAPSATRVPISPRRRMLRASVRFARLVHATSSTRTTAPIVVPTASRISEAGTPMMRLLIARTPHGRAMAYGDAEPPLEIEPDRKRRVELFADRGHLRHGLCHGLAGSQPAPDEDPPVVSRVRREPIFQFRKGPSCRVHRHPEAAGDEPPVEESLELRVRDADDLERRPADLHRLTHDIGSAAEAPMPEAVADHGHGGRVGTVVLRLQRPADLHAHAERPEIIAIDDFRESSSRSGPSPGSTRGTRSTPSRSRTPTVARADPDSPPTRGSSSARCRLGSDRPRPSVRRRRMPGGGPVIT